MAYLLAGIALAAAFYQLVALAACLRQRFRRASGSPYQPPVSVLKPVHGRDPHFYQAIESHARQQYPEFEILLGVQTPADPAVRDIQRLIARHPERHIRLVVCGRRAPNAKVGVLAELAEAARHPVLLVSDSDIRVPPGYLGQVVSPLEDPGCGIVTCVYRAHADNLASGWEALGIATDFAPSTLVAPLVGIREFGLGATLVFRAEDLKRIGGFEAISEYLADDYQLARHITRLGKRAAMSGVVVETFLGARPWREVWRHQVRWARTIRVSRGDGYLGLPVTHAGLWALAAVVQGWWAAGAALAGLRMLMALVAGAVALRSPVAARWFFLAPLWDLWAFAVWLAGLAGNTVEWRGMRLRLRRDGRIAGPAA